MLKESGSNGDCVNLKGKLFIFTGIIGSIIILFGLTQTVAQAYFVIGALLLLSTAINFKLTYFIALELILIAGHGAALLGLGTVSQVVLPILLCTQLLAYYVLSGQLHNIFRLIGIIGIALLSISFSYENQWIFFLGSLFVTIFSIYQVKQGRCVALIWVVLNMLFALIAAVRLAF